jgi:hypothetical protein
MGIGHRNQEINNNPLPVGDNMIFFICRKPGIYREAIEKYRRAMHIDPSSPEPRQKMDRSYPCRNAGKSDGQLRPCPGLV